MYYDSQARVTEAILPSLHDTSNSSVYRPRVKHFYNSRGYYQSSLQREVNSSGAIVDGDLLYEVIALNARGQITSAKNSNGQISKSADFDRATGDVNFIAAGSNVSGSATSGIAFMEYGWDMAGNLRERIDINNSLAEAFEYDGVSRLSEIRFYPGQTNTLGSTPFVTTNSYSLTGNLLNKGGSLSGYAYPGAHAVSQVSVGGSQRTFTYDANGNIESVRGQGGDKDIVWTSFNKPSSIARVNGATSKSDFRYAADHIRFEQVIEHSDGSSETKTTWLGGLEQTIKRDANSNVTSRQNLYHLYTPTGEMIAFLKSYGTALPGGGQLRYPVTDVQGSIISLVNENGLAVEEYAYDPWGKRRSAVNWTGGVSGVFLVVTESSYGYTGHEHLDHLGLVHMNGRVYDPELGRFLSADPFVKYPDSTQGFNRYAYVGNNPMSRTDPSGYFERELIQIGLMMAGMDPQSAAYVSAIVSGFVEGADPRDVYFDLLGTVASDIAYTDFSATTKALVAAAAYGSIEAAQGGRFEHGATSGLFAVGTAEYMAQFSAASSGASPLKQKQVEATVIRVSANTAASEARGSSAENGASTDSFLETLQPETWSVLRDDGSSLVFYSYPVFQGTEVKRKVRTSYTPLGGKFNFIGGTVSSEVGPEGPSIERGPNGKLKGKYSLGPTIDFVPKRVWLISRTTYRADVHVDFVAWEEYLVTTVSYRVSADGDRTYLGEETRLVKLNKRRLTTIVNSYRYEHDEVLFDSGPPLFQ
ncbi:MAG: RHS repeat-associated core domain-containing protein [Pseudomonadota bacterium]